MATDADRFFAYFWPEGLAQLLGLVAVLFGLTIAYRAFTVWVNAAGKA